MIFKVFLFVLLFCLSTDRSSGLALGLILEASSSKQLYKSLRDERAKFLLHLLCEKEKKQGLVPLSCYKLLKAASKVDFWCLSLKIRDLNVSNLKKSLKTKGLSRVCRNHLEKNLRVMVYRKKDFLLPELKNHWTDESPLL